MKAKILLMLLLLLLLLLLITLLLLLFFINNTRGSANKDGFSLSNSKRLEPNMLIIVQNAVVSQLICANSKALHQAIFPQGTSQHFWLCKGFVFCGVQDGIITTYMIFQRFCSYTFQVAQIKTSYFCVFFPLALDVRIYFQNWFPSVSSL